MHLKMVYFNSIFNIRNDILMKRVYYFIVVAHIYKLIK